ncbi:MAG: EF-hand domain-containing protein [Roseovarius sp.]|nr:EF-hand domain-containing protein [Roseovarius sp.]
MFEKLTAATIALVVALPAAGLAASAMDTDGDGSVSMEEFDAAMPDAGEAVFTEADTDGDGMLSADEIAAARENGILPPASDG